MTPFAVNGTRFLYVQINCADGKRRPRSTGKLKKKEATAEGIRMQAEEDRQKKAKEQGARTCRELIMRFMQNLAPTVTKSTLPQYWCGATICEEGLGDYADKDPGALNPEVLMSVRGYLYLHYSGNTIEDRGRFVKRLLHYLLEMINGPTSWLDGFKIDSQSDGDESPREIYSDEQITSLKTATTTEEGLAFINFAENIGARIGDQVALRISNYDPKTGCLNYLNTKTAVKCSVFLLPDNQAWVEKRRSAEGADPFLFPMFAERNDPETVADAWFAQLLIKAGIRTEADLVKRKKGLEKEDFCVLGVSTLSTQHILDLNGLAERLSAKADSISAFVWEKLDDSAKEALQQHRNGGGDHIHLHCVLVQNLNRIIRNGPMFNPERFEGIKLAAETRELLESNPQGEELAALNRMLLVNAFRGLIKRMHKGRKRRDTYEHVFHSFRNTLISRLGSMGVPLHNIMAIVGHKDPRTTRRYMHALPEDNKSAILLFGARGRGAWQQMADRANGLYASEADSTPNGSPASPPAPASTTSAPKQEVTVHTGTVSFSFTTNLETAFGGMTFLVASPSPAPAPESVPNGQEPPIFSAQRAQYDALMLSAANNPWAGIKTKK